MWKSFLNIICLNKFLICYFCVCSTWLRYCSSGSLFLKSSSFSSFSIRRARKPTAQLAWKFLFIKVLKFSSYHFWKWKICKSIKKRLNYFWQRILLVPGRFFYLVSICKSASLRNRVFFTPFVSHPKALYRIWTFFVIMRGMIAVKFSGIFTVGFKLSTIKHF